jgi:hypothetical protein
VKLERIADYELVEYLAAGGMADLYLARNPRQPAPVVLKTIQKKYVELTRVVRMFIDEGRIAKALDHPNIVRIHDVGEERGAYYIAMEFIAGRDLLAIARRGIEAGRFIPPHLAAAILAQVCGGLVYAHEKRDAEGRALRIVHCDISPGNVVVSFGGTAKIVDFGIARAAIQLRQEDHTVAGKFNYMAPEQIRGETLDGRADLFSLGVILYELIVGRRLFRGRPAEVKKRILAGDIPRPREIRPEISIEMERIILRALATDRMARYASARAFRADLLGEIARDGHAAGKREIAEYLREIFVPAAQRVAQQLIGGEEEPTSVDTTPRGFDDDDEELSLEAPVPGLAELVVDADDPEPPPLDASAEVAAPDAAEDITAPDGRAAAVKAAIDPASTTQDLEPITARERSVPTTDPTNVYAAPRDADEGETVTRKRTPAEEANPVEEPPTAFFSRPTKAATEKAPTPRLIAKHDLHRDAQRDKKNASRTELMLAALLVFVALAVYLLLRI